MSPLFDGYPAKLRRTIRQTLADLRGVIRPSLPGYRQGHFPSGPTTRPEHVPEFPQRGLAVGGKQAIEIRVSVSVCLSVTYNFTKRKAGFEQVKIFVSSTYTDLAQHRRALLDALHQLRSNVTVVAMEYFGASPVDAIELSRRKVLECDIYVGVLGWRYGSIDRRTRMSITEVEYRTALAKQIPTLLYLTSESLPVLPATVDTGASAKMVKKLRAEVKEKHVVQMFSTPEDLARRVTTDLVPFLTRRPEEKVFDLASPVGRDVNPAFPFLLCHTATGSRYRDLHEVTVYLDLQDDDPALHKRILQSIDRVVYQLHRSFVVPVLPMQNWREYCALKLRIWGEFWIQATVIFKDASRSRVTLQRYINMPGLPDPISDDTKTPGRKAQHES